MSDTVSAFHSVSTGPDQAQPADGQVYDAIARISNMARRTCMRKQLGSASVECCKAKKRCDANPKLGGSSPLGSLDQPTSEISWCQRDIKTDCQIDVMLHELAHSCGWDHGFGENVPGDSGTVTCKK
jgi:hypothetical protein